MTDHRETWLPEPDLAELDIATVLYALADPMRLRIIQSLHALGESTCTALDMPVKVSTVSHHMNILRKSGVVSTRLDGTAKPSRLRTQDLDRRFPGLLKSIINATPPRQAPDARSRPHTPPSTARP